MDSLTYDEKLKILGLSDNKEVLAALVDTLYDNYLKVYKPQVILKLLNKMLDEMGNYENINKIEDFKILVADLKKINGEEFVNTNLSLLREIKINLDEHLDYKLREKRKKYSLNVLRGLVNTVGYDVSSYQTQIQLDGNPKNVFKYILVKQET